MNIGYSFGWFNPCKFSMPFLLSLPTECVPLILNSLAPCPLRDGLDLNWSNSSSCSYKLSSFYSGNLKSNIFWISFKTSFLLVRARLYNTTISVPSLIPYSYNLWQLLPLVRSSFISFDSYSSEITWNRTTLVYGRLKTEQTYYRKTFSPID